MAYSKQTWSSNELITADKLNHIEDGIPTKTSQLSNDSGFLTSHQSITGKKNTQSAVGSPAASGTAVAFIDTIRCTGCYFAYKKDCCYCYNERCWLNVR